MFATSTWEKQKGHGKNEHVLEKISWGFRRMKKQTWARIKRWNWDLCIGKLAVRRVEDIVVTKLQKMRLWLFHSPARANDCFKLELSRA